MWPRRGGGHRNAHERESEQPEDTPAVVSDLKGPIVDPDRTQVGEHWRPAQAQGEFARFLRARFGEYYNLLELAGFSLVAGGVAFLGGFFLAVQLELSTTAVPASQSLHYSYRTIERYTRSTSGPLQPPSPAPT